METRTCNKCEQNKPISDFYTYNIHKCKDCHRNYQKNVYYGKIPVEKTIKEDETTQQRKARFKYLGKVARNATVRKSGNKLKDAEFYVMDQFCETTYHLEFIQLKDAPIESLDMEQYYFVQEDVIKRCLRLSDEFLKKEKPYRTKSQYEKKIMS